MIKEFKVEYGFLSNFYMGKDMLPIQVEGISFRSTEHAYHALKTTNQEHRERIAEAASPTIAKRMGSRNGHKGFKIELRPYWEQGLKIDIMMRVLTRKFEQPILRDRLLATGDKYLMEGNWWNDKFWGWCFRTETGLNMLGRSEMALRNHFLVVRGFKGSI